MSKILISLVLIATSVVSGARPQTCFASQDKTVGGRSQDDSQWRQYDLGVRFGRSLTLGCPVFVGTVRAIKPRPVDDASPADVASPSIADLTVTTDEWLWGEASRRKPEMQLERVSRPNSIKFRSDEGWSAWDGVEVQINERLLVVFCDSAADNLAPAPSLSRYGLIISDEKLFESVKGALALHSLLAQNPEQISQAAELLAHNSFMVGYLVSYLALGIRPHTADAEAVVLAELFGSKDLPRAGQFRVRLTLTARLLSSLYPISRETRDSVTRTLIVIAASDDVVLAKQAMITLLQLSDKKDLNMRPFLDRERRKRLSKIYFAEFSEDAAGKKHPAFESQLRASTSP